ncbi:MAG: trimeric intracellular cation channel family protein, partial [Haliea sp.]
PLIVVLMGTMTGVAGGAMRDIFSNQVPLLLRQDIYATAAIVGIALYLVLKALGLRASFAFWTGMAAVMALRLSAIFLGWHLPVFRLPY